MTATILELALVCLKLFYSIVKAIISWKEEERKRFEERIKTLSGLLKEAIVNKEESLNEDDYLSNLEWEQQERYKAYKDASQRVLGAGGGLNDLLQEKVMGMHLRIEDKKVEVVDILLKDSYVEEKAKLIAKVLVEL